VPELLGHTAAHALDIVTAITGDHSLCGYDGPSEGKRLFGPGKTWNEKYKWFRGGQTVPKKTK